jgi:hypothetical protein
MKVKEGKGEVQVKISRQKENKVVAGRSYKERGGIIQSRSLEFTDEALESKDDSVGRTDH